DMRVSVIPSIYGEKVVLRILEKSRNLLSLDAVGMSEEWVKRFEEHINKPNGIILVTGPTGSGKTTTLYAALLAMNRQERNILTIEDPVEYDVDGITQVQVNNTVGLDFASAIRSFLRQDPDVILVGEIRDDETAKTAVQASLTGHLVLSTLHTNDAPSAVARLIEMDIEPFLISSSLSLVAAQRLVRKNCPHCSETVKVGDDLGLILKKEGIELSEYKKGMGCQECFDTGYKGRLAIFEFLEINDSIRKLINRQSAAYDIREAAKKSGFKPMFYSGMDLVREGITTPEEILATTRIE
ncbi:MAG TPA: type II secretion system protein GspE, partial [Flexistipes sinusarabici]|nr:type II secretion system protein GspE [Flexistipes sinusarabici]